MPYQMPDSNVVSLGQPFTLNVGGDLISYPASWLQYATQDDLDALGIVFIPDPIPDAPTLLELQNAKILEMQIAYNNAIQVDVAYMGTTFQADTSSQVTLSKSLAGMAGTAPIGFYWVDSNNNQVPMNFAECQGLASVMFDQGWAAFQRLQNKKIAILAADINSVEAITWES